MHTRRLFRTPAVLAAAALLTLAGCTSGGSGDSGGSGGGHGGSSAAPSEGERGAADSAAPPLRPLPTAVPADLRRYYAQKLSWHDCGSGFQCTRLRAPLDYAHPDPSSDLRLAVARKKAPSGSRTIGSLLVNPGGPGGSAIDYLEQGAAVAYPAEVRDRYDLVGMDPRGVAASDPVRCLSDARMDAYTRTDQTPDDAKETTGLVSAYRDFAAGCRHRTGALLGHVSTVEAARDMDLLRAALGDRKLHYVGASYGTYLGATYAGLYPSRVGRLVLDGALDPTLSMARLNRDQTRGFETAFRSFAEDCTGRDDCPLGHGSAAAAGRRLSALLRRIDAHPLRAEGSRRVTESLATTGVVQAMYDEGAWSDLRGALAAADKGDGTQLLALSDMYYERDPGGHYGTIMFANPAVNCLDLPPAFSSPAAVRKALPAFEKASPVFGRGFAWAALNCGYWPERPTGGPHRITARGADPILVVGTTRDPATPYRWAQGLAGQLSSGHLLTYEGDGHTAYLRGGPCVDTAVDTYLLTGRTPPEDTTCP